MAAAQPPLPPPPQAPRRFGRFELRQMLGRSHASAVWLAFDPRLGQEVVLIVPRSQPQNAAGRDAWMHEMQPGAKLKHPRLTDIIEVGVHESWPYASHARGQSQTLGERIQAQALTPLESASIVADVLEGLAYAHEAGLAHGDIGLHNVFIEKNGRASLAGLGSGMIQPQGPGGGTPSERQQSRLAAERDVLMIGLLLYRLLANAPALDDADFGHAAPRVGMEIVRLPWTTPHPVPDPLRAIVNRATDRQQRQRYLNARTLLSALQGWIKTNSQDSGGPLLLLLDRLNSVGSLPGRPRTERDLVSGLSKDTVHVDDLVDVIVKNPTLSWELLRTVNSASFATHSTEDGVTTLSRAILLLGQNGLRRVAAGIRAWPGVLGAQNSLAGEGGQRAIDELVAELRLTCVAGHTARLLAPFSIHDEEASMAAMSQRLGWLLLLYHFPDEAAQIRHLMEAGPPLEVGAPPTAGMSQDAAVSAVLGVNLQDLGVAVLKHWGYHERLQQASRPLDKAATVRTPTTAEETLRAVASIANELASTLPLEPPKAVAAMRNIFMRYAKALELSTKECKETLDHAVRLVDGLPVVKRERRQQPETRDTLE